MDDVAVAQAMAETEQGLAIVNTRRHARLLYEKIRELPGAAHLSTLMCQAHRMKVLARIRADLVDGAPARLVSTTLIEAGVDVDFARVWRSISGLDSIAQAAGRCNREGRRDPASSVVTIFEPSDKRMVPHHVATAANAARQTLERFADDPLSPQAIEWYSSNYYWRRDFARGGLDRGDVMTIVERDRDRNLYPYATIANEMRMIDEVMVPVIVPYNDEARSAISALPAAEWTTPIARVLQRYTVEVPEGVLALMLEAREVEPIAPERYGDDWLALTPAGTSRYRDDVGLDVL